MRHVTLKQLRAFAAVLRTGSVTGAAAAVGVSPPAITLQMKLLRERIGLSLIERGERGLQPTEAGRTLLATVRRLEAVLADGEAELAALAGARTGVVHVGVISTAKYFAPHVLAAFARRHVGIEVKLFVGNRAEIVARLREREVDLVIMGRAPEELAVTQEPIGEHPHVIVAPPDHPLAGARRLGAGALADETFLVREPGSGTRTVMERFFADIGLAPRVGMEIGSNETVKQAVMAGLGIAFLSAHTIDIEFQTGRLIVLDVVGLPLMRRWHVVHLRQRRLTPAARLLGRFVVEEGARYLPRGVMAAAAMVAA
jgi:DNA-binding transcriptional LysR family regulator